MHKDNFVCLFMIQHSIGYFKYREFSAGFSKNSYEVHCCAKEKHTGIKESSNSTYN